MIYKLGASDSKGFLHDGCFLTSSKLNFSKLASVLPAFTGLLRGDWMSFWESMGLFYFFRNGSISRNEEPSLLKFFSAYWTMLSMDWLFRLISS